MQNEDWKQILSVIGPGLSNSEYETALDVFEECEKKTLAALKRAREDKESGVVIDKLSGEAVELRQNILTLREVRSDHE
ncbi:hypothetical protein [Desulfobacula sp.]|uniref:hypothetical protein n=1 Tax=Desulfobacula sp. TaxID=2593537 RepID=UPI0026354A7D|nr:hypothetical protein [Desulfobacula sp.]